MLNEEKKEYQSVLLTPTERAFLQTTAFDEMEAGAAQPGGTLHYLDAEGEELVTYRALTLFHRPNWYRGIKKTSRLDKLIASRVDGEMIHPGEITRRNTIREKKRRLETKREKLQARTAEWEMRRPSAGTVDRLPPERPDYSKPLPAVPAIPEALPCVSCGQVTTDYWSTFFDGSGRKLCRCRECLEREG